MEHAPRMSRRERLLRLVGGVGMIALGCVIYAVSQSVDPANRAAIVAIVAILIGVTWLGQGVRGHTEGPIRRDEAEAPVGPPISAERTAIGVLLGWAIPGLGHWVIGRRGKAVLYFVTITVTFVMGVLLAEGRNLSYERSAVYFLAYVFNPAETALGMYLTRDLVLDHVVRFLTVGFLYTAVASLLNLVAITDFIATCARSTPLAPQGDRGRAAGIGDEAGERR